MSESGYTSCGCFLCFEIAISSDTTKPELCNECEDAGCEIDGDTCEVLANDLRGEG